MLNQILIYSSPPAPAASSATLSCSMPLYSAVMISLSLMQKRADGEMSTVPYTNWSVLSAEPAHRESERLRDRLRCRIRAVRREVW